MGYVSFPRDVAVRSLRWQPPFDTAQSNRSEFTGGRQVVELPGGGRWRASGEFVPMRGQDGSLGVRAFLAGLRGNLNTFALPAWEKRFSSVLPMTSALQTIVADSGVAVSGRSIAKTIVTDAWDSQARSSSAVTGPSVVHFRTGANNIALMMGLNTDPLTDPSFTSIDHAIYVTESNFVDIFENGNPQGRFGTCKKDDLFSVEYTGNAVLYFHNGHLLRSVAKSAGLSFFLDSSFYSVLASVTDVAFTARSLLAAGSLSFTLQGFPVSTPNVVRAGQFVTALFEDGSTQLLTVKRDVQSDTLGQGFVEVDAPLRKAAYAVVTDFPFAHMALADAGEWGVDPGQIYSAGFTAEEAW